MQPTGNAVWLRDKGAKTWLKKEDELEMVCLKVDVVPVVNLIKGA